MHIHRRRVGGEDASHEPFLKGACRAVVVAARPREAYDVVGRKRLVTCDLTLGNDVIRRGYEHAEIARSRQVVANAGEGPDVSDGILRSRPARRSAGPPCHPPRGAGKAPPAPNARPRPASSCLRPGACHPPPPSSQCLTRATPSCHPIPPPPPPPPPPRPPPPPPPA